MKTTGLQKTIEQLLKVDPAFEQSLSSLKNKAKKHPSKATEYWKELMEFVNSNALKEHPKFSEIKNIFVHPKKTSAKSLYTFEPVSKGDTILGVIPENVADFIRRHDRKAIRLAKMQVEANMTHDIQKMAKLMRDESLMEISMRKIWFMLKDHFKIWDKPCTFTIKKHPEIDLLVLVEQCSHSQQQPQMGMMKINPDMLRNFFKGLGMEPPPEE